MKITFQATTLKDAPSMKKNATQTFSIKLRLLNTDAQYAFLLRQSASAPLRNLIKKRALSEKKEWLNKDVRQGYMEGFIEQSIAWQIKLNRMKRNLSQADLAKLTNTKQSSISRAENPGYGKHSLEQLKKIANAFDCAVMIKFISYSALALEAQNLSEESIIVDGFADEKHLIGMVSK